MPSFDEFSTSNVMFNPVSGLTPRDVCDDCDSPHHTSNPCRFYCDDCDYAHPAPINECYCYECEAPNEDCFCNISEETHTVTIVGIDVPNILAYRDNEPALAEHYIFNPNLPDDPRQRLHNIQESDLYRITASILNRLTDYFVSTEILRPCRRCTYAYRVSTSSNPLCRSCRNRITTCSECGHEFSGSTCSNCYKTYINDYNYNARPKFRHTKKDLGTPIKQRLYTGIEFEIETGDQIAVAKEIDHRFTWTYMKHDGSLNNGFEIVTHPFTHRWFLENEDQFKELFERLYSQDAYIRNTCGTHFHLSLGAFSNSHLFKFMSFIYENPDQMYKLSKRLDRTWLESYASMTAESKSNLIRKAMNKANVIASNGFRPGSKYIAVNIKDHKTVEVRIFAGCDSFLLFMGWYEFLHALYQYTKNCPFKNTRWADFLGWLNFDEVEDSKFPNLESLLSDLNLT